MEVTVAVGAFAGLIAVAGITVAVGLVALTLFPDSQRHRLFGQFPGSPVRPPPRPARLFRQAGLPPLKFNPKLVPDQW